jgi:hypothetical protein
MWLPVQVNVYLRCSGSVIVDRWPDGSYASVVAYGGLALVPVTSVSAVSRPVAASKLNTSLPRRVYVYVPSDAISVAS